MADGNRDTNYSLGIAAALLVTLFVIASYFSFWEYQNQHTQQRHNITAYQTETSEKYPEICFDEGTSFITLLKCLVKTVDANRNAQRTHYDLQAQQEMAEWAFAIVLLTIAGLVANLAGIYLLLRNLGLARKSNELTQRTFIAENRPWLEPCSVKTIGFTPADGGFTLNIEITFTNSGNSPAQNVQFFASDITDEEGMWWEILERFSTQMKGHAVTSRDQNRLSGSFLFPDSKLTKNREFKRTLAQRTKAVKRLMEHSYHPKPQPGVPQETEEEVIARLLQMPEGFRFIVSVVYFFDADSDRPHCTSMIYAPVRPDPKRPNRFLRFDITPGAMGIDDFEIRQQDGTIAD